MKNGSRRFGALVVAFFFIAPGAVRADDQKSEWEKALDFVRKVTDNPCLEMIGKAWGWYGKISGIIDLIVPPKSTKELLDDLEDSIKDYLDDIEEEHLAAGTRSTLDRLDFRMATYEFDYAHDWFNDQTLLNLEAEMWNLKDLIIERIDGSASPRAKLYAGKNLNMLIPAFVTLLELRAQAAPHISPTLVIQDEIDELFAELIEWNARLIGPGCTNDVSLPCYQMDEGYVRELVKKNHEQVGSDKLLETELIIRAGTEKAKIALGIDSAFYRFGTRSECLHGADDDENFSTTWMEQCSTEMKDGTWFIEPDHKGWVAIRNGENNNCLTYSPLFEPVVLFSGMVYSAPCERLPNQLWKLQGAENSSPPRVEVVSAIHALENYQKHWNIRLGIDYYPDEWSDLDTRIGMACSYATPYDHNVQSCKPAYDQPSQKGSWIFSRADVPFPFLSDDLVPALISVVVN